MPDRDWLLIVTLGIGWGATFFFNEVLIREIGPLSVSLARVGTAAAFCWLFLALTGRRAGLPAAALGQAAVMGLLMFAIPFAIFPLGQQFVASSVAGIVNAMTPVMVVIVSHLWPGGERATWLKSLGVVAGFVGIVLITLPALGSGEGSRVFGTLVIVLAPVSYAFALNYVRRLSGVDIAVMVTWAFSFAALSLVPLVLMLEGVPERLSAESLVSVAVLGPVLTGAAFLTLFFVMPRAGATKSSTVTFLAPVSALLIGRIVLSEQLGLAHFAGMAAIFLGLLLIDGRLFRRASEAEKVN